MKHIILTGFDSYLKNAVGVELSRLLSRPFCDMDDELRKKFEQPLANIYKTKGAPFLSTAENELLTELIASPTPLIIAAGEVVGDVLANLEILSQGDTFFLDCPKTLLQKIWEEKRPDQHPFTADLEVCEQWWSQMRPIYQKHGTTISVPDNSPFEVAQQIADRHINGYPALLKAEGHVSSIETVWSNLPEKLAALTAQRRGIILLDHAFAKEADAWQSTLPGFKVVFTAKRGEEAKSWQSAQKILTIMAEEKLARDDWCLVRGGGSLTDLGAFCAGLYRRGLNLALMPTTLLGAVDAAVGGKAAINFEGAKNQVGLFYLPRWVGVDLAAFETLPRERIAEGLVEAYKTGLLLDPSLAELVQEQFEPLVNGDLPLLAEVAGRSYTAKAALVARDFREEKGLRDILNLGHTYGHVVESYYAPKLSHGRAVALGLAVMAVLSHHQKLLDAKTSKAIIEAAQKFGGPWPALPPADKSRHLLGSDKKIRGGVLRFVVLEEPGRPALIEVTADQIIAAAEELVAL